MRKWEAARIHVWNLPLDTEDSDLRALFGAYGEVVLARVFKDRDLGISRGDGIVAMATVGEAERAMAGLAGIDYGGNTILMEQESCEGTEAVPPLSPNCPEGAVSFLGKSPDASFRMVRHSLPSRHRNSH